MNYETNGLVTWLQAELQVRAILMKPKEIVFIPYQWRHIGNGNEKRTSVCLRKGS